MKDKNKLPFEAKKTSEFFTANVMNQINETLNEEVLANLMANTSKLECPTSLTDKVLIELEEKKSTTQTYVFSNTMEKYLIAAIIFFGIIVFSKYNTTYLSSIDFNFSAELKIFINAVLNFETLATLLCVLAWIAFEEFHKIQLYKMN